MRIAIAGLGSAADQLHLPALRLLPHLTLAGAADPSGERRNWAAGKGIGPLYGSVEELLQKAKPDILIVGTPPESHRDIAIQALDAGAHVFLEKPITPTVSEADEIIAAAKSAGRRAAVDNQYRHIGFFRETRAAIDRGDFGRPYLLQLWQQMNPPSDTYPAWKASLERLVLYEFGTHALDVISYFLGGPLGPTKSPADAHPLAISTKLPRTRDAYPSDLVSVSRLDFADQVSATMVLNWKSRAPMRYLEVRLDCDEASLRLSLGGVARFRLGWSSEKRRPDVQLSAVKGGEARVEKNGASYTLASDRQAAWVSATANHIQQFAAAVQTGREPEGSAEQARELLRTALAAYESVDMNGDRAVIERPVPSA